MKNFMKNSFKIFGAYSTSVFLFAFFLIAPLSMNTDNRIWLMLYSFIFHLFMWSFTLKYAQKIGALEARPQNDMHPHPLKGFIYGIAGFLPYIIFEIIYFIVYPGISEEVSGKVLHVAFRCVLGPMYFMIRGLGYTTLAYVAASAVVPVVALIGYLMGYHDFNLKNARERFKDKEEDFLND